MVQIHLQLSKCPIEFSHSRTLVYKVKQPFLPSGPVDLEKIRGNTLEILRKSGHSTFEWLKCGEFLESDEGDQNKSTFDRFRPR
jgi:hypothetical protein